MHMPGYIYRNGRYYLSWFYAGGPEECKHSYSKLIDCPDCDEENMNHAKPGEPPTVEEIDKAITYTGLV